MLEILLVLFIAVSIGLLVSLQKNKKTLHNLAKEFEYERKISHQKIQDLRKIVSNAEELNAKYRKDISTLYVQRSDLQAELAKLKDQNSTKSSSKSKSKPKSNKKK